MRLSHHIVLPSLVVILLARWGTAADNGVALAPPMGWRSWNCFGPNVDQQKMRAVMDAMGDRSRKVGEKVQSLVDLGYRHCGLDDAWQLCGSGVNSSFHDAHGNPIVNTSRFPSMPQMTAHGHALGLSVGWYMNNCICEETAWARDQVGIHMEGSVNALFDYGFDGVKLDGCGMFKNLSWWYALINATGRPMLIENCHWGGDNPSGSDETGPCSGTSDISQCPFNLYRTSGDITNTWASMFSNLQSVIPYLGNPPLSRPGAWAYPDMLEVGRMSTAVEDRTHFGAWVIISAPLILGYDLTDPSLTDKIWPIISNTEAIAINQQWAGHPGKLVKQATRQLATQHVHAVPCDGKRAEDQAVWDLEPADEDGLRQIRWVGAQYTTRPESRGHSSGDSSGNASLCVDAVEVTTLTLRECANLTSQRFLFGDDGTLKMPLWKNNEGNLNGCLDISGKVGPTVQLTRCYGSPNDAFVFTGSTNGRSSVGGGQVWSDRGGGQARDYPKRCMEARHDIEILSQVWAKPLPGAKMAVFFLNNQSSSSALPIHVDLRQDLGLPSTGPYNVRDIWRRANQPTVNNTLTVSMLAPHDSKLYLLSPVVIE